MLAKKLHGLDRVKSNTDAFYSAKVVDMLRLWWFFIGAQDKELVC